MDSCIKSNLVHGSAAIFKKDEQTLPPAAHVFSIPEVLAMILDYALYKNSTQGLCRQYLINFRPLCSASRSSVDQLLKAKKEPLYHVTMTGANSVKYRRRSAADYSKILDKFIEFLRPRPEDQDTFFALTMKADVFRLENHEHLLHSLGKCGHLLVQLDLQVPMDGGSLPGLFPNTLVLPNLQKLKINFTGNPLENLPKTETLSLPDANEIFLLQSLLSKSRELKELSIVAWMDSVFQFMELPATLRKINMQVSGDDAYAAVKCLIKNRLPELKHLRLVHKIQGKTQVKDDLLYQMLSKFSQTLRILELHKFVSDNHSRDLNLRLRFPVMQNLGELVIVGMHSLTHPEETTLSTLFPKLKSLCLIRSHTESQILEDVLNATASSLTKLKLELIELENAEDVNTLPIRENFIRTMHSTLPCITDLYLYHTGIEFKGLQTVFREMRQLTRLSIDVLVTTPDSNGNCNHWDSLLIGAPLEVVAGLRNYPKFWNSLQLRNNDEPSIKMLPELTYLMLDAEWEDDLDTLISDISFIHALKGMNSLCSVKLRGRFMISQDIMDQWQQNGRYIDYRRE